MVDPLTATLTTRAVTYVVGVAFNMQSLSQTAKVNKEQAQLLAKRVQIVADYLKEMDTRRELLNIPRIDEILQELMETVGRAEELIQDYAAKNKWHKRLLTTGSFRASFADINTRLSNTLQMLDLGLSIHQTFPDFAPDLDAKAEQIDLADIRNQLDLIIERQTEEHKLLSVIYDRQQELSDKTIDSLKEYMQTVVISAQPAAKDKYAHLEIPFWRLCFEEQIGRGGFGVVYKGTYQGEPVAIKQLDVDRLGPVALKEFKNEIDVLSRITSRYIPRLYGICTEQGRYCIVMEFMPRGNLSEVLRDTDIDLPWSLRYRMALESARAMQLLYANGIQHRDFKSLNVLLDEYLHCKVSDFGLSKCKSTILTTTQAGGTSTLTSAMSSAATLCWLAPERMRIGARFDESCDSYSFGVTLYEIASRSLPFAGEDPFVIRMSILEGARPEIPKDTPQEFADLICSCWAHDPKQRPLFTEIVRRLEVLLDKIGRHPHAQRPPQVCQRRRFTTPSHQRIHPVRMIIQERRILLTIRATLHPLACQQTTTATAILMLPTAFFCLFGPA
ncbi:kinase-like domain-containing protein [Catenaria anguillulae PL171]|uniref:Kinase-like domain-containing protein n=1 Tax=Catenaria anguillulae PL171 TaxID=765915 RepID=A0A1Y2HWW7_9FUNG|nr:kinase-like domain-containing protein [Catenaria anguillulae PL171]